MTVYINTFFANDKSWVCFGVNEDGALWRTDSEEILLSWEELDKAILSGTLSENTKIIEYV